MIFFSASFSGFQINRGKKGFELKPLPIAAQLAPVYSILISDFNQDGFEDILLGGNFYRSKPEIGIYDGSYGLFLKGGARSLYRFCQIMLDWTRVC